MVVVCLDGVELKCLGQSGIWTSLNGGLGSGHVTCGAMRGPYPGGGKKEEEKKEEKRSKKKIVTRDT